MSEIEQLKQLVSKLRERDALLIDALERITDSLDGNREHLYKIVIELSHVRLASKGYERDFYDFVIFHLLDALNKIEKAMYHILETTDAYKLKGSYWRDIEQDEVIINE